MGQIRTRRWNDPIEPDDGWRILICRYRPRGVSKDQETWNQWLPNLGPSRELHAKVYRKDGSLGLTWSAYQTAYLREMRDQRETISSLAKQVAEGRSITLLCSTACERESRCHRILLKQLLEHEIQRRQNALDKI